MPNISPLFALEADKLVAAGRFNEAIDLCKSGIAAYPDYHAAYFVMSSAYKGIGDLDSALVTAKQAYNSFPLNRQLKELVDDIEVLIENSKEESINQPDAIYNDTSESFLKPIFSSEQDYAHRENEIRADNLSLIPGLDFSPLRIRKTKVHQRRHIHSSVQYPQFILEEYDNIISNTNDFFLFDNHNIDFSNDPFQDLARRIEQVKMNANTDANNLIIFNDIIENDSDIIPATDTWAEILLRQQQYDQAIQVYNELIDLYPDKKDIYLSLINDIQKRIG